MLRCFMLAYIDNVLVYSSNLESYITHVKAATSSKTTYMSKQ